jgi:hypothetical protein
MAYLPRHAPTWPHRAPKWRDPELSMEDSPDAGTSLPGGAGNSLEAKNSLVSVMIILKHDQLSLHILTIAVIIIIVTGWWYTYPSEKIYESQLG